MTRPACRSPLSFLAAALLAAPGFADEASLRRDVEFLASPALGGRLTGSAGEQRAAAYLAERLAALGALPLPGESGYRLPFSYTAGTRDAGSSLALVDAEGEERWSGADSVQALSFSEPGAVTAPVLFAGYGIVVPAGQEVAYDSFAGLDVAGKIVLVLRYFPEEADPQLEGELARYAGLRYKAMQARERGAVALLVATGPRSPHAGEVVPMSFDAAVAGSGLLAASVSGEVAARLLAAAGRDLAAVQAALDGGNPHEGGFELPGAEVALEVRVEREQRTAANVAGYLPGSDPEAGAEPWVLLGAHYDHLGEGGPNSLADAGEAAAVHPGADDNASGVAAVLAAGEALAAEPHARHLVLAFWSGEELGVLGSTQFLRDGPLPADQVAAYLNFDMVGRLRDNRLLLQGAGSSDVWPRLVEQVNVPLGFAVELAEDPYLPTDSTPVYQASVPTLNFFTGAHEDYHKPSDTAEKIVYPELARVARFGALLADRLADLAEPPQLLAVTPSRAGGGRETLRAFTGTIPDYASEVEGLRLSGVVAGGPAEAAGLAAGDVIVEFGGQRIANIYDYTYALDAVKIGEPVTVVYLRDGERREATVVPRERE